MSFYSLNYTLQDVIGYALAFLLSNGDDRTIYGVSLTTYNKFVNELEFLFTEDFSNWQPIDNACRKYSIDLLIFSDLDPAWHSLAALRPQRSALYENEHYSIFVCVRKLYENQVACIMLK